MGKIHGEIQLQERDIDLLKGLFECRIMTVRHITAIHFDGHHEATRKRVRKLRDAGYLAARAGRRSDESAIYSITRKAFDALQADGRFADYPSAGWAATKRRGRVSEMTLQHELSVMDVKAAFYEAVRNRPTLQIAEFTTWPQRIAFDSFHPTTKERVVVKPDGFIRIRETETGRRRREHLFFLEVDRSTETLDILVNRTLCYFQFYKRGGLAERFGRDPSAYKTFPFRLLIVCKSEERQDNIAARLLATNPPVRTFALLTSIKTAIDRPLDSRWATPAFFSSPAHILGDIFS